MRYDDALVFCKEKQSLVGTKGEKGDLIGAVVMVPADPKSADEFWKRFILSSYDTDFALAPYVGQDMRVITVDLYHLEMNGVQFYNDITEK